MSSNLGKQSKAKVKSDVSAAQHIKRPWENLINQANRDRSKTVHLNDDTTFKKQFCIQGVFQKRFTPNFNVSILFGQD